MNKWQLETSPVLVRRVGKTAEEAAELAKVCARIVLQGIDGVDPSNGKTNRQALLEELADVRAQIEVTMATPAMWITDEEFIAFKRRVRLKKQQMAVWESLYRGE